MLNKKYETGTVGLNYISLIHGIIAISKGKTSLIIDDKSYPYANKWYLNIGEVEKSILRKLGNEHDIDCLQNIENYLVDNNTILYLDDVFIEFSDSPYTNLKEMARKLPESFAKFYQEELLDIDPDAFDREFINFIEDVAHKSFSKFSQKILDTVFVSRSFEGLDEIFDNFMSYLNTETATTKQLHYILQVMFQTAFSSGQNELETKYLLLSLISPRYLVLEKELKEDLLFTYRKLDGDLKSTTVVDWGIKKDRLHYLLLDSIDGLTEVEECFYFGQLTKQEHFDHQLKQTQFLSINIDCLIDHNFVDFFKDKRIIFSKSNRMGSDFPFWEVTLNSKGELNAIYAYADTLGTKASFYYHHALEDVFLSLQAILPGLTRADWISRAKLSKGEDIWIKYEPKQKQQLHPNSAYLVDTLYTKEDQIPVEALYYCGPDRAKSLGLYSYLLDIFSPQ
jgi:hypothetical protein